MRASTGAWGSTIVTTACPDTGTGAYNYATIIRALVASICAPTSVAASARISRDGLSVPSSRLVPSAPVRPPNDLRAKMEATVLMSTCTRGYTDWWRLGAGGHLGEVAKVHQCGAPHRVRAARADPGHPQQHRPLQGGPRVPGTRGCCHAVL